MGTGGGPRQPVNNSDLAQSDVEAVLATDEAKQRLNEQLAITGVLALQGVDVEDISDPEVEVSQEGLITISTFRLLELILLI